MLNLPEEMLRGTKLLPSRSFCRLAKLAVGLGKGLSTQEAIQYLNLCWDSLIHEYTRSNPAPESLLGFVNLCSPLAAKPLEDTRPLAVLLGG